MSKPPAYLPEETVEELRARLDRFDGYPSTAVPVPVLLGGPVAFSAGTGLYASDPAYEPPPFPFGGVMVVAHNLDSLANYLKRVELGQPHGGPVRTMPYWANAYRLLDGAGLHRTQCFFTNIYVGLKVGAAEGKFPAAKDPTFRAWCLDFLAHQVVVMRPRLLVIAGAPAAREISFMSEKLVHWRRRLPPLKVEPATIAGHSTTAIALFHPAGHFRQQFQERSYDGRQGFDADVTLLRDAASAAGLGGG